MKGTEFEGKSLERIVKGLVRQERTDCFNPNAGQHYNICHFWKWMKPNGGGNKLPRPPGEEEFTKTLAQRFEKFKDRFRRRRGARAVG